MLPSNFLRRIFGLRVRKGEVNKAKPLPFKHKAGGMALSLVIAKGKASKHGKLFLYFERAQMLMEALKLLER